MMAQKKPVGRAMLRLGVSGALLLSFCCAPVRGTAAQEGRESSPTAALTSALVAACRQEEGRFAVYLTRETAGDFNALPQQQRIDLMKRLVLLGEVGKPLLSSDAKNRTVLRCTSTGVTVEMRLEAERVGENYAFIPVDATSDPLQAIGGAPRRVLFGLIREGGGWRIFSVGLLVLNLPELSRQWAEQELEAREQAIIQTLRLLADKIGVFERAFGRLPDKLEQLGPSADGQISTEAANLIDEELAGGRKLGYAFRYRVLPPDPSSTADSDAGPPTFEIAANPLDYGRTGRRSFFLDSSGTLRGADKQGAVATREDARVEPRQ